MDHDKTKSLAKASKLCRMHARNCKECFVPIMDEEGNPQYESEACMKGAEPIRVYMKLEAAYFNRKESNR